MSFLSSLFSISIQLLLPALLLSGCLTTAELPNPMTAPDTPTLYRNNQEAWQNAALRENDLFAAYQLSIFASVGWTKRTDATTYQFTNITMAAPDDKYRINLLAPTFSQKMACGWYCEYLDQPVMRAVLGPYTMLDKTYEGQKGALLNFYSGLTRLNQQLNSLDPVLQALMPDIFASLTATKQSFESLPHVVDFLNNYFDELDFNALLDTARQKAARSTENDAPGIEKRTAPNTDGDLLANSSQGLALDPDGDLLASFSQGLALDPDGDLLASFSQGLALDPDGDLLASFSPSLSVAEMLDLTIASTSNRQKHRSEMPAQKSNAYSLVSSNKPSGEQSTDDIRSNTETKAMQQPHLMISVGQLVCSYQGNYFGIVMAIENKRVNLKLIGQAKRIEQGLLVDAQDGLLFLTDTDFSYFALDTQKNFDKDQVSPCYLSGF